MRRGFALSVLFICPSKCVFVTWILNIRVDSFKGMRQYYNIKVQECNQLILNVLFVNGVQAFHCKRPVFYITLCRDPRWGRGQETPGEGIYIQRKIMF